MQGLHPAAGGIALRGLPSASWREAEDVAAIVMAETLRVGGAMLCSKETMGDSTATAECWFPRPPSSGGRACAAGRPSVSRRKADGVAGTAMVEPLRVGSAMLCT